MAINLVSTWQKLVLSQRGESPSLQSIIFLPTIESSIIAQWWSYCAAGADRLRGWIMAVQRVEGVVKHFFFFFFWVGRSGDERGQVMRCKYTLEGWEWNHKTDVISEQSFVLFSDYDELWLFYTKIWGKFWLCWEEHDKKCYPLLPSKKHKSKMYQSVTFRMSFFHQ